jgi:hypothetical protein
MNKSVMSENINKFSKYNPINEINDKLYLNNVSLKFRYEQMELNKIAEKLNPGRTKKHKFKRSSHIGHNLDKDIMEANSLLNLKKRKRILEGKDLQIQNNNQDNSIDTFGNYNLETDYQLKNINTVDIPIPRLPTIINQKETSSNYLTFSNLSLDDENESENNKNNKHAESFIQNDKSFEHKRERASLSSFNNSPLKGVNIKLVNHKRNFSLHFKNPLDVDKDIITTRPSLLDSPSRRDETLKTLKKLNSIEKKKVFGKLKDHPKRDSIIQKNSIDDRETLNSNISQATTFEISPLQNENDDDKYGEYEKVNYDNTIHLVKKFLIPPNTRRNRNKVSNILAYQSNSKHSKNIIANGHISLSQLYSKLDDEDDTSRSRSKLIKYSKYSFIRSSDGQIIYALKRNVSKHDNITGRRNAGLNFENKYANSLPKINTNKSIEKPKDIILLEKLRTKNQEKQKEYSLNNKVSFEKDIQKSKSRLDEINIQIKSMLAKASKDYTRRLDKIIQKKL